MNINSSLQNTPIAVIGLSAIFADAKNIEEFWTNIIQSKDSIKEVPNNRWSVEDYYDSDVTAPDKTYCKVGGFLPEIDFNPMEFGLPPNILEVTDASQLLGLIAARDALQDAGYGNDSERFTKKIKEKTGVLLGVGGGQKLITPLVARLQYPIWERALRSSGVTEEDIPHIVDKIKKAYVNWSENSFPGLLGNVISGRITNRFDLGGINSVVDAACAASLSAVKMSLSELVEGRCDMMLTGGVDTDNSPFMYMSFSKTPAFSKSGKISPFSDKADGMLIGEGIGMMVLKRLADAEKDGDRIYAVIKGIGTSSDGRFKSVYAPRSSGQQMAMQRAYEDAGYAPSTVGLLEAHGTGTGAGDPTEFSSMQTVFGTGNTEGQHIALGSVKSQIGHAKAAAGAAGMIKAVLALHHKVFPPTINVEQPNLKFDIEKSAIYINTEARPWLKNGYPRRTGVSAFGFGGINVHITMEEYEGERALDYRLHEPYKTILLHAATPQDLQLKCQEELDKLQGEEAELVFRDLTINSKDSVPPQRNSRIGFMVANKEECISSLQLAIQNLKTDIKNWNHTKGIFYRLNGIDLTSQKVVALFAGQGSQYVGMGKELANAFPIVSDIFERVDALFQQNGEPLLSNKVFPIPSFSSKEKEVNQKTLTETQFAQPAIGCLSLAQYKILEKAGFKADFVAGHSFGELTALCVSGAYDEDTFFTLAKTRGAAMAATNSGADSGTMIAIKASLEEVQSAIINLPDVCIANVNSNNQVVLGGSTPTMKQAEEQLKREGILVTPLAVSAAFHTDFVKHAQMPFSSFIDKQKFNKPEIPVYSNTTAQAYSKNPDNLKSTLKDQILNPVLFRDLIKNIHKDGGRIFVEFGPKGVLTNLVKNILKEETHVAISINPSSTDDSDLQFRQAVLQLRVLGLPLSDIDPYKRGLPAVPAKTKLNVTLSGNNYISELTKKTYEDVMNDDFKISGSQTRITEKVVEKTVKVNNQVPTKNNSNVQTENEEEMMNKETLQLLQTTLNSFNTNQTKSLEIFERFMNDQNQHAQQLLRILSDRIAENKMDSLGKVRPQNGSSNKLPPVLAKTLSSNNGNGTSVPVSSPDVKAEPATPATANVSPNGFDSNRLGKILLEVVSEKTGYPAEMLDLKMDMEADLGIDSIKRVEIFGALTQKYPEISGINPNELTELRTLDEIINYVSGKGGVVAESSVKEMPTPTPTMVSAPNTELPDINEEFANEASNEGSIFDSDKLEKILLEVVSEKTGYPAEMLDLKMDMEADLGIDSIKRVEIFGALKQKFPEMSDINPNELTELHTLEEIVSNVGNYSKKKLLV